jgi:hypothetical protein
VAFNVNLFTASLKLGGQRSSLFQVNITNPVNGIADIQVPFMVKASQIPASTLTTIPVSYFGRKIKVAGNREFADWTTTILNDEDFLVRNAIEEWSNSINSYQGNRTKFGSASPSLYKTNAQITAFSKTGVPLRIYSFVGLYPQDIQAVEMNWETDAISETIVTWAYDYFYISGGITGRAGGF